MPENDLPLVPPARLAVLLIAKRRESGVDLVDLSRRSDQRFSPAMLEQIEKGVVQLDERALRDLVKIYGLESSVSLPSRSKLILDLDARQLGVGDTVIPFESSTTQVVLERYVSLLYLLRNEKPGRVLPLRDADLDVLGSSLGLPEVRLRSDLGAIMDSASTDQRTSRLSRHLSLAAAGLLVGVTAVGSLVIVGAPETNDVVAGPIDDADPVPTAVTTSSQTGRYEARTGDHRIGAASTSSGTVGSTLGAGQIDVPRQAIVVSNPTANPTAKPPAEVAVNQDRNTDSPVDQQSASNPVDLIEEPAATGESITHGVIDLTAVETHLGRDLQALVPGWAIEMHGELAGYKGQTNSVERTIKVFVDDGATVERVAEILAHEIGHAIDIDRLDTESRLKWVEMRGMPQVWWAGEGLSDFAVGAGDFAEGVAAYLAGSASASEYGEFNAEQLAFVGQFVG